MRVYFEDGSLTANYTMIPDVILDAAEGTSYCINVLDDLLRNHRYMAMAVRT